MIRMYVSTIEERYKQMQQHVSSTTEKKRLSTATNNNNPIHNPINFPRARLRHLAMHTMLVGLDDGLGLDGADMCVHEAASE